LNDIFVSAGTNFSNKTKANIGSLKNTGFELAINYKPFTTGGDWYWDLGLNMTYNKNEITELIGGSDYYVPTGGISSGTGNYAQAHAVGHHASSFYVFQQVYGADGLPLEGVYVDRNGDGKITTDDKYFYKSPAAPWTFGFSSKLMYKSWDFSFSLRASLGNYVYNDQEAGFSNISKVYDASFNYLTNRPFDVLPKNWQTYDNALSDYFVHNASFLKCDNITLGYSFDELFKTGGWHGLSGRVYANVSNVFTITKYKGLDPEVFGGIDNNMYPRPLTVQLGLSLNF
jgi:iron complex outermembrane receptor protein